MKLDVTPIHLGPGGSARPVGDFSSTREGYQAYVARYCAPGEPGRLVVVEHSTTHWDHWESHPAGDEVVIVLSGRAELIQRIDGEDRRTTLGPGDAIVNPAGVWHTADVLEPMSAVYITPGPGTQHRSRAEPPP
jgi:quercetin dioxygenase-like cupin family protein